MKTPQGRSARRMIEKLAESKFSGIAIKKLEKLASRMGVDEKDVFQLYVKTKNNVAHNEFAAVPFAERIVFLPQCLRPKECPAKLDENGYECQECGRCSLSKITHLAKTLGYKGTYILPGGSIAKKILLRVKPKACLGVACFKELVLGSFLCEKLGVISHGIPLSRDGCINTLVDWKRLRSTLHLQICAK